MTTTLNDANRQYSYNLDDDGSEYSYDERAQNKRGGGGSVGGYDDSSVGEGSSSAYNLKDSPKNDHQSSSSKLI